MPACSFTAEQLASFAHDARAFPGLAAVRVELLHRDSSDRQAFQFPPELQPVDYCSGFHVFWKVPLPFGAVDSTANMKRGHSELLLAFSNPQEAAAVLGRMAAQVAVILSRPQAGERRMQLLEAPTLGEERLAGSFTSYNAVTERGGNQHWEPHSIQYDFTFRRGPVLVLCSDHFAPDSADVAHALALAEALDERIAAAQR